MTNEELGLSVGNELFSDPRLDSAAVAVSAEDGDVTLRGTMGSFREKREVLQGPCAGAPHPHDGRRPGRHGHGHGPGAVAVPVRRGRVRCRERPRRRRYRQQDRNPEPGTEGRRRQGVDREGAPAGRGVVGAPGGIAADDRLLVEY